MKLWSQHESTQETYHPVCTTTAWQSLERICHGACGPAHTDTHESTHSYPMSDRQETYIYESPDGGHTVYRRPVNAPIVERELHSISIEKQTWDQQIEREMRWLEIIKAGDHDSVLRNMLDQIEIYHKLKSQP